MYKSSYILLFISAILLNSCANDFNRIRNSDSRIAISHVDKIRKEGYTAKESRGWNLSTKDSLGKSLHFSEAVFDKESGKMIASRKLTEIVVTSRSSNISERDGMINIDFVIKVPKELISDRLQLTIEPTITEGINLKELEKILISGKQFKYLQIRGYRKFENYLKSIIPDDADYFTIYTELNNLTIFLQRHLPESRMLDGCFDDSLTTENGIKEREILDHYVKKWLVDRNEEKKAKRDKMYRKYVKVPMSNSARLDSVVPKGESFEFYYKQQLPAQRNSKKIRLFTKYSLTDSYGMVSNLGCSDTLSYSISSLTAFIDTSSVFTKRVISRRDTRSFISRIKFKPGDYRLIDTIFDNTREIQNIHSFANLILCDTTILPEKLVITASGSPEGSLLLNKRLSLSRGRSIADYLFKISNGKISKQNIVIKDLAEDWESLRSSICNDSLLINKEKILSCFSNNDLDLREHTLKQIKPDYHELLFRHFPNLRKATIEFNVIKKQMTKDTIHTKEIDTLYMRGVEYLKSKDYKNASKILFSYRDRNAALALLSEGNPIAAEGILRELITKKGDATSYYMLSMIKSRKGEEEEAVRLYKHSTELDRSFIYRGYLDPEIYPLIQKFNLNKELFD